MEPVFDEGDVVTLLLPVEDPPIIPIACVNVTMMTTNDNNAPEQDLNLHRMTNTHSKLKTASAVI